jgi:hypothetical protein
MIRERLENLGFSQDEIQGRLARLSDEQIHQLALTLEELRVAGDGEIIIIIVLAVVLGIVLYFWLTGRRVVVTK